MKGEIDGLIGGPIAGRRHCRDGYRTSKARQLSALVTTIPLRKSRRSIIPFFRDDGDMLTS